MQTDHVYCWFCLYFCVLTGLQPRVTPLFRPNSFAAEVILNPAASVCTLAKTEGGWQRHWEQCQSCLANMDVYSKISRTTVHGELWKKGQADVIYLIDGLIKIWRRGGWFSAVRKQVIERIENWYKRSQWCLLNRIHSKMFLSVPDLIFYNSSARLRSPCSVQSQESTAGMSGGCHWVFLLSSVWCDACPLDCGISQ